MLHRAVRRPVRSAGTVLSTMTAVVVGAAVTWMSSTALADSPLPAGAGVSAGVLGAALLVADPESSDPAAARTFARERSAALDKAAHRARLAAARAQAVRSAAARQKAAAERRVAAARASRDLQRAELAARDPRTVARALVASRGWDGSQFGCLNSLWTKESNWKATADNPTSSAYGIPQALPGAKMSSAGSDWRTNPATQIRWGLGYIADRYGTPCVAWQHSRAHNWY